MNYKLELSAHADAQIDHCIQYVRHSLHSKQGASAILDDLESAFTTLEMYAESFAFCEDPYLRSKEYRKLSLEKHDYILIYRIVLDTVYIIGFFHMKENYHLKL